MPSKTGFEDVSIISPAQSTTSLCDQYWEEKQFSYRPDVKNEALGYGKVAIRREIYRGHRTYWTRVRVPGRSYYSPHGGQALTLPYKWFRISTFLPKTVTFLRHPEDVT